MQSYNYLSNRQLFFNTENGDEVRREVAPASTGMASNSKPNKTDNVLFIILLFLMINMIIFNANFTNTN